MRSPEPCRTLSRAGRRKPWWLELTATNSRATSAPIIRLAIITDAKLKGFILLHRGRSSSENCSSIPHRTTISDKSGRVIITPNEVAVMGIRNTVKKIALGLDGQDSYGTDDVHYGYHPSTQPYAQQPPQRQYGGPPAYVYGGQSGSNPYVWNQQATYRYGADGGGEATYGYPYGSHQYGGYTAPQAVPPRSTSSRITKALFGSSSADSSGQKTSKSDAKILKMTAKLAGHHHGGDGGGDGGGWGDGGYGDGGGGGGGGGDGGGGGC